MVSSVYSLRGRIVSSIEAHKTQIEYALVFLALTVYAIVVVRTAWISDDAYITFRTVDNFVNGYGLTWNVAERVQTYTNPLWLFAISAIYRFVREIYLVSVLLSIIISLTAASLFAFKVAGSRMTALLGIVLLTLSKAFIDYSTSGLENPLTHLILVWFFIVCLHSEIGFKSILYLSFIASMGALNRMDTFLLFLPTLVFLLAKFRKLNGGIAVLVGFMPFILWECFSIFYYGFPFPNTAYAKLGTGISNITLAQQGLYYLWSSLKWDPITLLSIAIGIAAPFIAKDWRNSLVSVGIVLYLLYIVKVGGDFMTGRFLAAPFLCAVMVLSRYQKLPIKAYFPAFATALIIGFSSPYPTLLSDASYGLDREGFATSGVGDERGFYYQCYGFLKVLKTQQFPDTPSATGGRVVQKDSSSCWVTFWSREVFTGNNSIMIARSVGYLGFDAGPQAHIVDVYALGDPLLARLPAKQGAWVIGHFRRTIPAGYLETLATGRNTIRDAGIATYYDKLAAITRGNLVDGQRLAEIWNMNTGKYSDLIGDYASLSTLSEPLHLTNWQGPEHLRPGETGTVTLYWQAPQRQPYDYFICVYLMKPGTGEWVALSDKQMPLPTSQHPGEIVPDVHTLTVPAETPPGIYLLGISIYQPYFRLEDDVAIQIFQPGTIKITPPLTTLPSDLQSVDSHLGDQIDLLGYTAVQDEHPVTLSEAKPGRLTVTLYWRSLRHPEGDYVVFVHAQDANGQLIAQSDAPPFGGSYPTSLWDVDDIIATVYTLDIPEHAGELEFFVGMYTWPAIDRLAVVQDGHAVEDGRIRLGPSR